MDAAHSREDQLVMDVFEELGYYADKGIKAALDTRVQKVYGDAGKRSLDEAWAAYEKTKTALGMADDHAHNFERAGVVLQPHQIAFAVAARSCDHPDGPNEVGFGGARGPGKSFVIFAQMTLDDCKRAPGIKALYLRRVGKAADEQMRDLVQAVLGLLPANAYRYVQGKVEFPNGSRVVVGGFKDDNEADKYQGNEYDLVAVEETTQLKQRTYEDVGLSTRSSKIYDGGPWRARTYNSTNPLGRGHQWYKKRFVDNERARQRGDKADPKRRFIAATVDQNRFISAEYIERLDGIADSTRRKAFRLGDWDVSAGAYFDNWNRDRHVIPQMHALSPEWRVWCSMDYGFKHPNVVHLHAEDGDGNRYTVHELSHTQHYPVQIAPDIITMLSWYGLTVDDLEAFYVGTDAFAQTGRNTQTVVQQYRELGIQLIQALTTPGSRIAGAQFLSQRLGNPDANILPTWFITEKCPLLIETLPYLQKNPNNVEDVLKTNADGNELGDDAYDCARYGMYLPARNEIG